MLTRQRFGGTIPTCLFNLPKLGILHLAANNLQGTLPSIVNFSATLQSVILSNNQLEGSIPSAFFNHTFYYLDLSFNRLNGKLETPKKSENFSRKFDFGIRNRTEASVINILHGNMFSCDTNRNNLPNHDPDFVTYQCGSDYTNQSLYKWVGIFGGILVCIGITIFLQQCSHFLTFLYILCKTSQSIKRF
jgi:hypothetical protein